MSVTEIIAEFKKLPASDQRTVVQELSGFLRTKQTKPDEVDEFNRLADEMFAMNAELFRKLAS